MLGSSVDRELPPSFLWKNCHKKYNCWDKKITFTIALTSFRKNSKNLFTYTLFSSGKNPRAVPRGRWKLHGIQEEKKRLDSRQEVWFVGEKNVPQWNQIWFSDSNLLLQNPAEVMGDNKSCKSAKDEHSCIWFFSSMNFDAIRDYVFFVFLFFWYFHCRDCLTDGEGGGGNVQYIVGDGKYCQQEVSFGCLLALFKIWYFQF